MVTVGQVRFHKVVSALPSPLEKDGVYLVRTGEGFDLYASDSTGTIAHKVNTEASGGGSSVTLDGDTTGYVNENKTYTITNYSAFSQYTAQASAGQASVEGDTVKFKLPGTAGDVTLVVGVDDTETQFNIQVKAAGVQTPQGVAPAPGALLNTPSVTLASSEFTPLGAADTHASSDWQISTDSSFSTIFKSTSTDAANKTSWSISGLQANKIYFWRVRYHGVNNGTSGWSTPMSFQTAAVFSGSIGEQGAQGFGVGVYPGQLPEGFTEMEGARDKASANYGNYTYTDGSVMVFVPRFYYRFGDLSSPRYLKYGRNAIDVVGIETFADEASANAAGYVMHRAFKDGGQHKVGFFIDKYLASKNESTGCKSVGEGIPISLTNVRAPTRSAGMSTTEGVCGGNLSDAVLLARSRGIGRFNCASIFMYGALAFLSFAHAQASTSTAYCAWYNEPHNFPKGCNDGALRDINDSSVQYALGEQHASQWGGATVRKPQTGGCYTPAKVAHNGQLCGVMDLNGVMHEVAIGVTAYGVRENDRSYYQTSREGCLKESVALASLTHGWGGATDVWQSAAGFGSLYETLPNGDFMGSESGSAVRFGNGVHAAFSNTQRYSEYWITCCAMSRVAARGIPSVEIFGQEQINGSFLSNLCVLVGGAYNSQHVATSGVFAKVMASRKDSREETSFRCAAYGE